MKKTIKHQIRAGEIAIPASKSDGQRAILSAALSNGKSTLRNLGKSHDELAMLAAIEHLGAKIERIDESSIHVFGINNFPLRTHLNMGESGLGIRLMTCICAAHKGNHTLTGTGSLASRPLTFFRETFPNFGVTVLSNTDRIPLHFHGPLQGATVTLDGSLSSQYISGLLMALPLLQEDSSLTIPTLNSVPYVQMTLATLEKFGIKIEQDNFTTFAIKGKQSYLASDYLIESDWSSASCWLVASALGMNLKLKGLSLSSLQADKKILDAFLAANCTIVRKDDQISVDGTNRKPFYFDATHCPDLFPALATFAALCDGISEIKGVGRLQHKESDRGLVLKTEFAKIGVEISLEGDLMHIVGKTGIKGGEIDANNDHRIAMCFGIAACFSDQEITISGAESVSKSYPDFWIDLESLAEKG